MKIYIYRVNISLLFLKYNLNIEGNNILLLFYWFDEGEWSSEDGGEVSE